jgi:assimilatory nitrate reductase catalytic subunit
VAETLSTCPYCGVGCGVVIEHDATQITGVRGDPAHPANFGRLCSKGQTLAQTATAPVQLHARLRQPLLRSTRTLPRTAVSWNTALDHAADRFADIIGTHGPDAVGLYLSGQLLTEDYYAFNKIARGLVGTNNVDTNSRLCMASAAAGYKATLGADAPPACYDDLALAHTLWISGANPAWAHPVLVRRIEDAKRAHPAQRMVVVDPRRTETAAMADLHLALLPGSDVALCHGLLHLMLWEGWCDDAFISAHTSGFGALKARVREFTPAVTAKLTGLRADDIVRAARWFAGLDGGDGEARRPTLSLYCQGLNQSRQGTANNAALINLHLACGQIGRPGAGPLSLTGQPNAMGGREVGAMAHVLGGHRDASNPEHRDDIARLWGVPALPSTPGKAALEMFEAAADGQIKALWIVCTNPAQSLPDQALVRRALQRCEFVLLHEAFADTATAALADLLLPAASWGEKSGTVTNSERRISRVRAAVPPPGEARPDLDIALNLAQRLQARLPATGARFDFSGPEAVWNEHRESTRGRDLDITGLSWTLLDAAGPQQWPLPEGAVSGCARLYQEHQFVTPDGRARFFDTPAGQVAEGRDARYPFSLGTGRLRDHWHGGSRTGQVGSLFGQAAEPVVQMHPQDMARLRVAEGDLALLASRRGQLLLPVQADKGLKPAQVFVAMHWGGEFLPGGISDVQGGDAAGNAGLGVNGLTSGARCPTSRQPELKHCAVRITRADKPWRLLAAGWFAPAEVPDLRRALAALGASLDHASLVPFASHGDSQRHGLLLRGAHSGAPSAAWLTALQTVLSLHGSDTLCYDDARRSHRRALRLDAEGRLGAVLLSGSTVGEDWLRALLQAGTVAPRPVSRLLAATTTPPLPQAPRSPQVCTCHDISQAQIVDVLPHCPGNAEQRLQALQAQLHCGTSCGSCLPTLRRLVAQTPSGALETA